MRLLSHTLAPINLAKIALSSGWLILMDAGVVAGQVPACPGIHVTILGIRNSVGTVDCALFDSPNGFPRDVLHSAMRLVAMRVPSSEARCDFEDIPSGAYALVVLHDENMNGKLDTNWAGVPTEGYGFSNNARGVLSAPGAGGPWPGRRSP